MHVNYCLDLDPVWYINDFCASFGWIIAILQKLLLNLDSQGCYGWSFST